jgi:hypothetical protein
MKITKSKLSKIIQEEVVKSIEEGMMDAIKNKLSPKRPTATAPRKRSENGNEKMYQMGVEDAEDAMHISGDYRESPSSDDEDYMAGWNDTIQGANSALQEGTSKMKITKSKLAQIIQEELKATLSEDGSGYSWGMRPPPKDGPSVDEAAADSGVQQMIYDYIEDNLENGPLSLDNILTLTQPTADDAYAPLEDIWEEVLEAAIEELELAEEIVRVQDWNDPSSLPRWTI